MIGLAAAAILLTPVSAPGDGGHPAPLSVALSVQASGAQADGGQDVSYAIVVRNTSDRAVPDAVITQQLPASLDYTGATPTPHRTGRHLTWTLAIPAHGTAHITTTGATGHHLEARPLDHATQAGTVHRGHHQQLTTTVCARDAGGGDTGPQACATGHSTLHAESLSRWEGTAAALAGLTGASAACFGAARLRRRRRASGRAGVEG
ncbi:DUF11 domain-containing protein [Catenulispora rubra]|uniref:DUF11 domain-containing protein n=1 Tax=Catenulispora rubra TaxID=280293 RepID=UPI0018920C56|nr:DUF11 domain-containing protein [Catenulispora rubra]